MVSRVAAAFLAVVLLARAGGEVVRLEMQKVIPLSIEALQLVYAFSSSPAVSPPVDVSFDQFSLSVASGDKGTGSYGPVTVALVPWDMFDKLSKETSLCSSGKADLGHVMHLDLKVDMLRRHASKLPPGIYVVSIVNCGESDAVLMSGTISVKSAHGFLSGNESSRVLIHGAFAVVLAITTIVWVQTYGAKSSSNLSLENNVTLVSLTSFASSIAWLATFYHENESGEAPAARLVAVACVGLKISCGVIFVLYAAMGSGIFKEELGRSTECCIILLGSLSGLAAVSLVLVLEERQALATATQSLLYTAVPCTAVVAVVLSWTFRSLARSIRRCKDTDQACALAHFHNMTLFVSIASLMFLLAFVVQIFEQPGTVMPNHVLCQDILVNLILCASLFGIMCMWAAFIGDTYVPNIEEQKVFASGERMESGSDDDHDILADEDAKPPGTEPRATTIGTLPAAE